MWPYWIFFCFLAFVAVSARPVNRIEHNFTRRIRLDSVWILTTLLLALMMGLRYRVGGDWFAYERMLEQARYMTFDQAVNRGDPGYWVINWIVGQAEGSLVRVNLIIGAIFSIGLVIYCRSLPRPWLAITVAFPYLILVVGMGYARQGVALALIMIGLVALGRGRFLWFVFWVMVAALFHKTAVVMIALGAMSVNRNRRLWLPIVGLAGVGGYFAFLGDETDDLIANYITAEYQSSGAFIRLSMNLVPALLFFIYRRYFLISDADMKFWLACSIASAALFGALMAGMPSTALDRISLYLIPLQLFVFSNLPDVLGRWGRMNTGLVMLIAFYYALVLFVWLNFAANARGWLPYRIWFGV